MVRPLVLSKLTLAFNDWLQQGDYPSYLKHSRVVPLSKEATIFPKYGAIRTISIASSISKVWEKIILSRVREEVAN
eukprot:gene267-54_t